MASVSSTLPCVSLLTDFYQLTMAYASWRANRMDVQAEFALSFRSNPFHGGYTLLAGLETATDWLERFRFEESELKFLAGLKGPSLKPLFEPAFLEKLGAARFTCDVEAMPEGTVAFPFMPIVKVRGPLWQCQWVESALLNLINFQTLVATKAARVVQSAKGAPVIEFGLRRAQGIDGAISASRACYIGGVDSTSNLLAAKLYGIPLRGTHAHSWIMSFESEEEAFRKYAEAFPDTCTLLVDTYDTVQGVTRAARVGQELKAGGHTLAAVRLDSGDFAYLSQKARAILDEAGLQSTKIVASNELDEYLIQSLRMQEARIDQWGVGTKMVTAQDQPALNGVYKLTAICQGGAWSPRLKVSDQPGKTSLPGRLRARRFYNAAGGMEADLIYEASENPAEAKRIVDPVSEHRQKAISPDWTHEELLVTIFEKGKRVLPAPSLSAVRERTKKQLASLHAGHRRLENPHVYPVGLSPYLADLRTKLIAYERGTV